MMWGLSRHSGNAVEIFLPGSKNFVFRAGHWGLKEPSRKFLPTFAFSLDSRWTSLAIYRLDVIYFLRIQRQFDGTILSINKTRAYFDVVFKRYLSRHSGCLLFLCFNSVSQVLAFYFKFLILKGRKENLCII